MKTVLILVISSQDKPYDNLYSTQYCTWQLPKVQGVDTIFYFGGPVKENTDKCIYFPVKESLHTMGEKTLLAYEWALKNKQFDYIARVNSSTYVDKKELSKYIQTLPDNNVFAGLEVAASETQDRWMWGPQFIFSKDIIELIVANKENWNHKVMDDNATSQLLNSLNVPYTKGKMGTIDKMENGYRCLNYGGEKPAFEFTDFEGLKGNDQHFYRVKQDLDRTQDVFIMEQLYKVLA